MFRSAGVITITISLLFIFGGCDALGCAGSDPGALPEASAAKGEEIEELFKQEKFDEAKTKAEAIAAELPRNGAAQGLLAMAHFHLGDYQKAITQFNKAIELAPESGKLYTERGLTYAYAGKITPGLRDIQQAIRLEPENPFHRTMLGKLYAMTGKTEKAARYFQAAIDKGSKAPDPYFQLGMLNQKVGDEDTAVELWEKALSMDPDFAEGHQNLGVHYLFKGDGKKALEHFKRYHELRPDIADGFSKVAQAHTLLGNKAGVDKIRSEFMAWYAKEKDKAAKGTSAFCFDQFEAEGGRFYACETVGDVAKTVKYRFKFVQGSRVAAMLLIEKSPKGGYILGGTDGQKHITFPKTWPDVPEYADMKDTILKAHKGEIKPQEG